MLVAGAVMLVCVALAVPRLLSGPSGPEWPARIEMNVHRTPRTPTKPVPRTGGRKPAEPSGPDDAAIATAADGDLAVSLQLRWPEFEAGERVLGKVTYANHAQRDVYVPASGEPHQGLAIVIEDAEGHEVRRIVEASRSDQLPRRLTRVPGGGRVESPVTIVAEDEDPLAPGTYTVWAELRFDERLVRLGLPMWKAPKGPARSDAIALVVKPRSEQR